HRRGSVRERAVELHLDGALGEPFLLAALAEGREVRGLAVGVEGRIVLVLLVEDEEVGILRRPVRSIDETARLGATHRRRLLLEERRQRVALPLRRAHLRHHRQHVRHRSPPRPRSRAFASSPPSLVPPRPRSVLASTIYG